MCECVCVCGGGVLMKSMCTRTYIIMKKIKQKLMQETQKDR